MRKFKVIADSNQLKEIGIDYSITGLTGELIREYPSGWIELEITHTPEHGITFTNQFDFPKTYLTEYYG